MSVPLKQKEVFQPSKLRARRRKLRFMQAGIFFFFVAFVVAGGIGFFYIPALRVRDVAIYDTKTVNSGELEQVLREELSGKKGFVLPKNNAFLFSETALQDVALRRFPKIKQITISLSNFHLIEVHIVERSPYGLWCGEKMTEKEVCVYLDESGVLYERAPEYSGDAYVRWYGPKVGETLGGTYLGSAFSSLSSLISELEKEDLRAKEIDVEKSGDVHVYYDGGFELIFTLLQKPEALLSALHTAEKSEVLKDKELTDLQYLDMRFLGNRLYYKIK